MQASFVLGNGLSRQSIDLNILKQYGKIYGCNALYREFTPDYLVAVDRGIITEIIKSGFCQENPKVLHTWNTSYQLNNLKKYKLNDSIERMHIIRKATRKMPKAQSLFIAPGAWDSGVTATLLASRHIKEHKEDVNTVFILGIDISAALTEKGDTNNIYCGTDNYETTIDHYSHRCTTEQKLVRIANFYKKINYVRVLGETSHTSKYLQNEINRSSNISQITIEEFKEQFNGC